MYDSSLFVALKFLLFLNVVPFLYNLGKVLWSNFNNGLFIWKFT